MYIFSDKLFINDMNIKYATLIRNIILEMHVLVIMDDRRGDKTGVKPHQYSAILPRYII